MKSICLFASYFETDKIPYYVKVYLTELTRHFSEVVFLTNNKIIDDEEIPYLQEKNISIRFFPNEGYDFGMWYKVITESEYTNYDRIGLVNDSCILFSKLDNFFEWVNRNNFDYCGILASFEYSYHLQSFFLIINKRAIAPVQEYFKNNGVVRNYLDVVDTYEIGLCNWLISKGMKTGAYFPSSSLKWNVNPFYFSLDELILNGIPLIKKKILFRTYNAREYNTLARLGFDIDVGKYIQEIKQIQGEHLLIDFEEVLRNSRKAGFMDFLRYRTLMLVYKVLRCLSIISVLLFRKSNRAS